MLANYPAKFAINNSNAPLTVSPLRFEPCASSGTDVPADLSAAVDVYSDWVDACDAVAREGEEDRGGDFAPSRAPVAGRPSAGRARDQEEDDDDIIDDADEDGMDGYGGEGIVADDEY